jgi:hypothetical protein
LQYPILHTFLLRIPKSFAVCFYKKFLPEQLKQQSPGSSNHPARRQAVKTTRAYHIWLIRSHLPPLEIYNDINISNLNAKLLRSIKSLVNQLFLKKKFLCFYLHEEVQHPKQTAYFYRQLH